MQELFTAFIGALQTCWVSEMNATSVGGIGKPWTMMQPDTVTLFVWGFIAGVGVGFWEETEDSWVLTSPRLITKPTAAKTIAKIITVAKVF